MADCLETGNWTGLLDDIPADIEKKDDTTVTYLKTVTKDTMHDSELFAELCELVDLLEVKIVIVNQGQAVRPDQLSVRGAEVYKELLSLCSETELVRIQELIKFYQNRWSGRTIDALVTRFHYTNRVSYYLDVTDLSAVCIVKEPIAPGRTIKLFDIGEGYRSKMIQYSKTYFDCFARGVPVLHRLSDGTDLAISLCQSMFFIWADRHKIFDFLQNEEPNVMSLKRNRKKTASNQTKSTAPVGVIASTWLPDVHETGWVHMRSSQ